MPDGGERQSLGSETTDGDVLGHVGDSAWRFEQVSSDLANVDKSPTRSLNICRTRWKNAKATQRLMDIFAQAVHDCR